MAVALSSTGIQKVIQHPSLPLVAFIFKPNQTNLTREFWPPNSFGETISRGPHWRKRGTWVKPGTCYPVLLPLDSHQPPPATNQPFCHPQTQTKPLLGAGRVFHEWTFICTFGSRIMHFLSWVSFITCFWPENWWLVMIGRFENVFLRYARKILNWRLPS